MLRSLITATVAVTLLAGCSGGGDEKSSSDSAAPQDGGPPASSTPTGPELATFDPPKAFAPVSAVAEGNTGPSNMYSIEAGMVGQTSLYALRSGLTGRTLSANSWQVPASDVPTTTTNDFTAPMAVQLDGQEVIVTAYTQMVQGSGTQKSHGQVSVQWIDPAEGDVLATAVADLSTLLGPGNSGADFFTPAYDVATGQIAVGVKVSSPDRTAKLSEFTVFADPATKKATTIAALRAAGVANGVVVGAQAENNGAKSNVIIQADGASGTVRKKVPVPASDYLFPVGSGGKHAYFTGSGYVQDAKNEHHYRNAIYAADLAGGTVVENKMPDSPNGSSGTCWSDHMSAVVCNYSSDDQKTEILGFDDTTGKKAWGYDSESANRVVPTVTTIYNGMVYGTADDQAILLDAKTGQDVAVPSATPSDGGTPTDGATPTEGATPTDGTTAGDSGNIGGWGDTSLLFGEPKSPAMVSKYGSVYLQNPGNKAPRNTEKILVVQKAIG